MKKSILMSLALISLFSNFQCGKEDLKTTSNQCIKAKLVYKSCASTVIEILDPNHFSLTETNWTPLHGTENFNNVCRVANPCFVEASNPQMQVGDVFYFEIDNNNFDATCIRCALFDAPPQKTVMIKVLNAPCNANR
jgi:hypothetical protein